MKTKITLLVLFLTTLGFAQNGINYKAVIKDDVGNVVASQTVSIRFTILEGETNVYQETHSPMTDANGIAIVNIGEGTSTDDFSLINWGDDDHFLEVEVDIAGGTAFEPMGTTQFKTVPYAIASGDKSWEVGTANVHVLSKNVGIGTDTPTELLHIYDDNTSGINLSVPNFSDQTQLEFKNGLETSEHSFFKIENSDDLLKFEIDTDLSGDTGYESKMTLNNGGLALENGTRINEFSTDATLAQNSDNIVPTEAAVKAYVDNSISAVEKTIIVPATQFVGNQNVNDVAYANFGAFVHYYSGNSYLMAPLILPLGATVSSIRFFVRDNTSNPDANIEVALLRSSQSSSIATQLFSLSTTTTGSELNYNTPITIADNYQYILRAQPTSSWDGIQLAIHSVKITYTE